MYTTGTSPARASAAVSDRKTWLFLPKLGTKCTSASRHRCCYAIQRAHLAGYIGNIRWNSVLCTLVLVLSCSFFSGAVCPPTFLSPPRSRASFLSGILHVPREQHRGVPSASGGACSPCARVPFSAKVVFVQCLAAHAPAVESSPFQVSPRTLVFVLSFSLARLGVRRLKIHVQAVYVFILNPCVHRVPTIQCPFFSVLFSSVFPTFRESSLSFESIFHSVLLLYPHRR